jgi:anaerobic magnesium-protoporphyrin IX monomethyl ester cyclase
MDILLCNSYYLAQESMPGARGQPYAPLGILYLAAYLRRSQKFDVGVFDTTFADGLSDFEKTLQRFKPHVVGLQGLITTRRISRKMIEIAKHSGAVVVVGGPDPSSSWEDYISWGADYVVIGEGEIALFQLMTYLFEKPFGRLLEEIPGLVYLQDFVIHRNTQKMKIPDLDIVPIPAYDLIDIEPYFNAWREFNDFTSMHLLTSRGCPFSCEWCSHAVFGRTYRQRSVNNVIEEMHFLRNNYNPDHLTIGDDTFGLDKKWLFSWCDAVKQAGFSIRFRCFTRADVINEDMLLQLKRVGCSHIHLGVESGSQRILDSMNKGMKLEDIYQASMVIKESGIGLGYFIMFAYPGETYKDIRKTEKLIFDIKPNTLGISIAFPVPGTRFYERVKDQILSLTDQADEQMGSGYQLRFKATYPIMYYRLLIRYIGHRCNLFVKNELLFKKINVAIIALLEFIFLRTIERVWQLRMKEKS